MYAVSQHPHSRRRGNAVHYYLARSKHKGTNVESFLPKKTTTTIITTMHRLEYTLEKDKDNMVYAHHNIRRVV